MVVTLSLIGGAIMGYFAGISVKLKSGTMIGDKLTLTKEQLEEIEQRMV